MGCCDLCSLRISQAPLCQICDHLKGKLKEEPVKAPTRCFSGKQPWKQTFYALFLSLWSSKTLGWLKLAGASLHNEVEGSHWWRVFQTPGAGQDGWEALRMWDYVQCKDVEPDLCSPKHSQDIPCAPFRAQAPKGLQGCQASWSQTSGHGCWNPTLLKQTASLNMLHWVALHFVGEHVATDEEGASARQF